MVQISPYSPCNSRRVNDAGAKQTVEKAAASGGSKNRE
jgi:hypothetical protein